MERLVLGRLQPARRRHVQHLTLLHPHLCRALHQARQALLAERGQQRDHPLRLLHRRQMVTRRTLLLARLPPQPLPPLTLRRSGGSPLPLQTVTRRRLRRVRGVQSQTPAQLLVALLQLLVLVGQAPVLLLQSGPLLDAAADLLALVQADGQQHPNERLCARHAGGRRYCNVSWHEAQILPPTPPPPAEPPRRSTPPARLPEWFHVCDHIRVRSHVMRFRLPSIQYVSVEIRSRQRLNCQMISRSWPTRPLRSAPPLVL